MTAVAGRALATAAVAALAVTGCVSETVSGGGSFDASADAAGRARSGWSSERGGAPTPPEPAATTGATGPATEDGGDPSFIGLERPDPSSIVKVPVQNVAPVDAFFDGEGFLLGETIEIDCSYEPFMARMVALAAANEGGKYVVRTDAREGSLHVVTLRSTVGGTRQSGLVPRASFAPQNEIPKDPVTGEIRVRPVFEFVAAESIVVRLHLVPDPDRPIWFRARVTGSPQRAGDTVAPVATYMNPGTRRRARGPTLGLGMEVRRTAEGRWSTRIDEPADAEPPGRR